MVSPYSCCNSAPVGKDKFARNIPTKGSNTFTYFLAIFYTQNPAFTQTFASV